MTSHTEPPYTCSLRPGPCEHRMCDPAVMNPESTPEEQEREARMRDVRAVRSYLSALSDADIDNLNTSLVTWGAVLEFEDNSPLAVLNRFVTDARDNKSEGDITL